MTAIHPERTGSPVRAGWYSPEDCHLGDFRALVEQSTDPADYPHADQVIEGVLIYGDSMRAAAGDPVQRRVLQTELATALLDGPGIVVFKGAFDADIVDRATAAFADLIAREKATGQVRGDHFAKPGSNDRVWGALDKLAVAAPEVFVEYYANDTLALISEAWLGSNYQLTSQVNVVNPGGQAQVAHRDYHLGFMDLAGAQAYPAQVHALSPMLTLQGAVAHVDMPVETGPTLYLPHSQKYPSGYLAYHDPAFTAYFDQHYVQLPLEKGDAAFFNPALFHGAGTNQTADVRRMANLLQVSSAFGRAMETVNTLAIIEAIYPSLQAWASNDGSAKAVANVVTAAAEGYPFPTNLDLDQPIGSMVPPSQADILSRALAEGWDDEALSQSLRDQLGRRESQV